MALEQVSEYVWRFKPGPLDVHTHPRIFDAINNEEFVPGNDGREGKAGLSVYTEVALKSGITAMIAMPNESARIYDLGAASPEQTVLVNYPIATLDRVIAVQAAISHEAVIPTGVIFGLDPSDMFVDVDKTHIDTEKMYQRFVSISDECLALKTYGAETTGGYNINIKLIYMPGGVAELWYESNPEKPHIMHLEDADVGKVLTEIAKLPNGMDMPIHIAHVSSRQELEAIIEAKQAGMNVTCEVTPHHLFMDEVDADNLDGYGCMKPTLKSRKDVEFLWAHMEYVDIIASDCAPHRKVDKEADQPTYGVTNHTYMLYLLFGAAEEGKISYEELYDKLCVNPRKRFNLPPTDDSFIRFDTHEPRLNQFETPERYGYNPFSRLNKMFNLVGNIIEVKAGASNMYRPDMMQVKTSYTHLIRPKNFELEKS